MRSNNLFLNRYERHGHGFALPALHNKTLIWGTKKMIQFCHIQTAFLQSRFSVNTTFNDLRHICQTAFFRQSNPTKFCCKKGFGFLKQTWNFDFCTKCLYLSWCCRRRSSWAAVFAVLGLCPHPHQNHHHLSHPVNDLPWRTAPLAGLAVGSESWACPYNLVPTPFSRKVKSHDCS